MKWKDEIKKWGYMPSAVVAVLAAIGYIVYQLIDLLYG
jgi:hypothetical protein